MSTSLPAVWPVSDIVIFDCDSTLTAVEGIDELARLTDSAEDVASLTRQAMDGALPLDAVYERRLDLSNPTRAQVRHIQRIYRENVIPDAPQVVRALQDLGCQVFIVSGGLIEAVRDFGVWLGAPPGHIYAVEMEYDQLAGQWWRYWEQVGGNNPRANYLAVRASPLTRSGGKISVVTALLAEHPGRAILVGDGVSDLEARDRVNLFVGFGGAVYREHVAREAPLYIKTPSLAPLLPLALGRAAARTRPWGRLYAEGLRRIEQGEVIFNDRELERTFTEVVLLSNSR
ncbi:MAG TPA: HAD-IB family phosphatase [Anaerolineales bacterium]|nr:HAD-IB family phosphatase [Anaerolineales bacterium]